MKEPMQRIVEAAGECWHETNATGAMLYCVKCGAGWKELAKTPNPSPTDLNELFRLAERLGLSVSMGHMLRPVAKYTADATKFRQGGEFDTYKGESDSSIADALLNALDQAIQEVSDE